jgi:hypothetical protein
MGVQADVSVSASLHCQVDPVFYGHIFVPAPGQKDLGARSMQQLFQVSGNRYNHILFQKADRPLPAKIPAAVSGVNNNFLTIK